MSDQQLEIVAVFAKLIRKAKRYNSSLVGAEFAVPVTEISSVLEQYVTEQTVPLEVIEAERKPLRTDNENI